jgi:phage terminase large subunit GpA-like protein
MEFDSIHWGGHRDYRTVQRKKLAFYTCTSCGMDWNDAYRDDAVKEGIWVPDKDIDRPSSVAFHLPSWYSPFVSLSDVAEAFLKGLQDPKKMQAFVTQHKAEPWKEVVERKDEKKVLALKNDLAAGVVPKGTVALTCGIDMQKSGFWFVVRAWTSDLSSHLVQYGSLSHWSDVEALVFGTRYPVEGSTETMGIWRAGIDTGGGQSEFDDWSRTEEAYQWLRSMPKGVVYGIKGASRQQLQRVRKTVIDKWPGKNRPMPGGLELRLIDTSQFKGLIHWRMTRKEGETQRFTLNADTGIDYAAQILSEELRKGRKGTTEWKRVRKDNHLLDAEVYAAACADGEWTPSLAFLANNERKEPAQPKTTKPSSARPGERQRPGWYANR